MATATRKTARTDRASRSSDERDGQRPGKQHISARTTRRPSRRILRQQSRHESLRFSKLYADIQKPSVGLAMSGGGIRSAMFCSGVLRQLLSDGVRIDYLSSVSGGGYVASSYMDWKYREGGKDSEEWHERYFQHLLQNVPNTFFRFNASFLLGLYDFLWHAGGIFLNTVVLSLFTRACYFLPLALAIDLYAGEYLRGLFSPERAGRESGAVDVTAVIAYLMVASCLFNALFHNMPAQKSLVGHALRTVCVLVGILCGITAKALAFEEAYVFWQSVNNVQQQSAGMAEEPVVTGLTLYWSVIAAYLLLWAVVPGSPLRRRFVVLALMAIEAYVVQLRVFAYHRDEQLRDWMDSAVDWSAVFFLLHPVLEPLQQTLFFHVYRNNIRRAFYHPAGCRTLRWVELFDMSPQLVMGRTRCLRKKSSSFPAELTMGDASCMENAVPEFIAQMVANNWTYDVTNPEEVDYKLLTISSRCVDIIDYTPEDESRYLDVTPWNVKLSTAMAASAAAFSIYMGRLSNALLPIRELCVLIGVRVGVNLPVWIDPPLHGAERTKRVLMFIVAQLILGLPLYMAAFFPTSSHYMAVFSVVCFGLFFFATFPTGHDVVVCSRWHQICDLLGRWFVVNLPQALFIRDIVSVRNIGHYPGYMLHLSDGGHVENLGLLSLLKRRANFIVVADGSMYDTWEIASEVTHVMLLARRWLGCSFTAMDGTDIEADLYRNFVKPNLGGSCSSGQPHCHQFKVTYSKLVDGVMQVVDEGRILLLQPRHPANVCLGDAKGSLNDDWCADEADQLTGLFSKHLHGRLQFISHRTVGVFPSMSTYLGNFFTPQTVKALHREGLRAMSAPLAKRFVGDLPRAAPSAADPR